MERALERDGTYNACAALLDRTVARGFAEKAAFIDRRRSLTYRELQDDSRRFANLLHRIGVRREQRVALLLLDTVEFPIAFLGAIRAGIVPVPLNTLLTAEQYAYILRDARARALVVSAPLLPVIEPVLSRLADLERVIVVGGEAGPHVDFA